MHYLMTANQKLVQIVTKLVTRKEKITSNQYKMFDKGNSSSWKLQTASSKFLGLLKTILRMLKSFRVESENKF
ncbi:hypothetical protein BpHYR1_014013 [Brachionus plicatilis]|uniref:Uncharacterized protein n=1 Tax=Brachionus plicatilis TaxID=10195 RepID=A0A3M7QTY8_BRAPC|nr:hypothetical protein BpHYR1_014013 [Brachionus plicatilis]